MLETKDLYKKYKPKKGKEVVAVDHVSLKFPEKGMVFLLGKSGSGKSTMLNLLGGLDSYDGGEIIIKGISSKDFNQQRFDSYRNTYVGFIFQEYNVLEEFNVGANIALALELQGKKATDEEINRILKEVDLDGFGERNPNELSGGQKQRVAIARALVKNPEIIMADEPTGALDSATGRQVLDTLKKLSEDKLVVIVSHDREYAEQYADRIIELSDGKVISDVEVDGSVRPEGDGIVFDGATADIPAGYQLTDEDRLKINEYISKLGSGLKLSFSENSSRFKNTDESKIPVQDGKDFALIKSVLPLKSAFRIGRSSLKHKKFRLVMTIFLSVVAFSLFAFVDTFSSYDLVRSCVDSLRDSDIGYVSLSKSVKRGSGIETWWSTLENGLTDEDLDVIENETGIPVTGIFKPKTASLAFEMNIGYNADAEEDHYDSQSYLTYFCGFSEITEESLENMGYSVYSGKLPDADKDEIAISRMAAETFLKFGYITAKPETENGHAVSHRDPQVADGKELEEMRERKKRAEKFSDPMYLVGKTLLLDNKLYKITAIIDTDFDFSRYEILNRDYSKLTKPERVLQMFLESEYRIDVSHSLTGAAMVGKGALEKMIASEPEAYEGSRGSLSVRAFGQHSSFYISSPYYSRLSDIPAEQIIWADKPLEKLEDNEIIVSLDSISAYYNDFQKNFIGEDGKVTGETFEAINDFIAEAGGLDADVWSYDDSRSESRTMDDIKIVGCFDPDGSYSSAEVMGVSDAIVEKIAEINDGVYDCAVGPMPQNRNSVHKIVSYCYREDDALDTRYEMNNAVAYELDSFNSFIKYAAKILFWVGVFFAAFASLLMANFISTSISYKKQEIGILRAIGSRSNDVFRIFFSESFIIAMIEFVITTILCFAAVCILNWVIRRESGILITFLHFGIRQVALILVISIAVAALASFFPVRKTAKKKPIDAIRGR